LPRFAGLTRIRPRLSEAPSNYTTLSWPKHGPGARKAWLSTAVNDPAWDAFLRRNPCGQFQQSSLWAAFKAAEGWRHHRVVLTDGDEVVGGFQILWKKKGLFRVGYVSKGPVSAAASPPIDRELAELLPVTARQLRLTALILQAPDESPTDPQLYTSAGFLVSNPMHVVEATYVLDLDKDIETLRGAMSASLRRNLRKAKKQPASIRLGAEQDLPAFFELMASTCRRQGVSPNPARVEALRLLWSLFAPEKDLRLTLVECGGETPAAKLSLGFGSRYTVWKKGWNGGQGQCHPNELLEDDAIAWALGQGYRLLDFCSFNRRAAERLLAGESAEGVPLSSRDEYHLRFGGRPLLLPRAMILLPNVLFRWLYRLTYVSREKRRLRARPA
jgi:CelD/BcsL family acetyltransferase involved in cellulose biosynthesis